MTRARQHPQAEQDTEKAGGDRRLHSSPLWLSPQATAWTASQPQHRASLPRPTHYPSRSPLSQGLRREDHLPWRSSPCFLTHLGTPDSLRSSGLPPQRLGQGQTCPRTLSQSGPDLPLHSLSTRAGPAREPLYSLLTRHSYWLLPRRLGAASRKGAPFPPLQVPHTHSGQMAGSGRWVWPLQLSTATEAMGPSSPLSNAHPRTYHLHKTTCHHPPLCRLRDGRRDPGPRGQGCAQRVGTWPRRVSQLWR